MSDAEEPVAVADGNEEPAKSPSPEPGDVEDANKGNELDELVKKVRQCVTLAGMSPDMWTDDHTPMMGKFFTDPDTRLLVVYIDKVNGLTVDTVVPNQENANEIAYFICKEKVSAITTENFHEVIQWGSVRAGYLDTLLRMMNVIYAPMFFQNKAWPDSIKNDFSSQLHRFLAGLTDIKHKIQGKTVLYIPNEGLMQEPGVSAKDKEFVQRLETAMIHWTRQIKEVLNAQDALETSESSGPLEEIEFWNNRCIDLSGLSEQLDKPGVKRIQKILELAKSSYVVPFKKLSKLIQDGSAQAQSNLKFLSLLREPCEELNKATPKNVPTILPKLVSYIRVIWVNSEFYNTRERLTALFRKLSNDVIRVCCREISLDRIFDGFVDSSIVSLNSCIECCLAWKGIYNSNSQVHHKFSKKGWILDESSIFAQVDAFIQRCRDLLEVCECQKHFARRKDGDRTPLPSFPGQRGPEI